MGERARFVLVHGTGDGGWVWRHVAPLLRQRGHEVYTPTLTGLGERSHLCAGQVDFEMHLQDITSVLEHEDLKEVVLVGHSYGGMVITGVAARVPERLSRLIYLDAYVPLPGETAMDLWPAEERQKARLDLREGRDFRENPPLALLGIEDPVLASWIEQRVSPQPYATYDQPVPAGKVAIPQAFIRCTEGPGVPRFQLSAERVRRAGGEVRDLAAPHLMMFTHPEETAALLIALSPSPRGGEGRGEG